MRGTSTCPHVKQAICGTTVLSLACGCRFRLGTGVVAGESVPAASGFRGGLRLGRLVVPWPGLIDLVLNGGFAAWALVRVRERISSM